MVSQSMPPAPPACPGFRFAGIVAQARFDVKLFVDTDPDIRLMRRIRRDLEQRGRTFAQVRKQYYESVRPMHVAFVEPSKRFADVFVAEGGQNRVALEIIMRHVRARLHDV